MELMETYTLPMPMQFILKQAWAGGNVAFFLLIVKHFYFRHDKENSVTSAIVTINSGGNGPGQGGHNGGPGPGPDQAGHIGPIQMYSSSTASIPDPAAQVT